MDKKMKEEVLNGVTKGTWYVHGLTSSVRSHFIEALESSKGQRIEVEKPTRLESITAAATATIEGVLYAILAQNGVNAYYFPLVTNAIDLVGFGTYLKMQKRAFEGTHYSKIVSLPNKAPQ